MTVSFSERFFCVFVHCVLFWAVLACTFFFPCYTVKFVLVSQRGGQLVLYGGPAGPGDLDDHIPPYLELRYN